MKKLLMIIAIAVCGINQMHAQFYVGGSVGFTSSKISMGTGSDESGSSYKILPEIGYKFSDQMSFGVSLGYLKGYAALGSFDVNDIKALGGALISTAADLSSSDSNDMSLKAFRIAPYLRYTVFESGMFQFFIDGVVGYSSIKADAQKLGKKAGGDSGLGNINMKDRTVTGLEMCIRPGIAVNLNDNFSLFAKIGSLGYQTLKLKDSDFKLTRIGFDLDSNNLLLGAIYYF